LLHNTDVINTLAYLHVSGHVVIALVIVTVLELVSLWYNTVQRVCEIQRNVW
jgi:hypothetical protein